MDALVQDAVRAAMARESTLASSDTPAEATAEAAPTAVREVDEWGEKGVKRREEKESLRSASTSRKVKRSRQDSKSDDPVDRRKDRAAPAATPAAVPAVQPDASKSRTGAKKPKLGSNWAALRAKMPKPAPGILKRRPRKPLSSPAPDAAAAKPADPLQCSMFVKTALRTGTNVKPTKVVALDCEFVGVGPGGKEDALARASLVNSRGEILYDSFVRVETRVVDYRFQYSGVTAEDITGPEAADPREAQREIADLLKGRILVGHAVKNDLRVLRIPHPQRDIRDTSDYYKKLWKRDGRGGGAPPALRLVVARVLGVDQFQTAEHDSCEDARAALALYKKNSKEWESSRKKGGKDAKAK